MKKISSCSFLVFVLLLGSQSYAGTITNTQSGNWSAMSTWGGNPVPVAGDDVIVNGDFTVTIDVADAACSTLQLGGSQSNTGDGTLAFTGVGHLVVSGAVTLGVGNRKGNMDMATGGILNCEGFILNSHGTWTPGIGTIELTASNTLPASDITSFNNLTIIGGATTLDANISIFGILQINSGSTLNGALSQLSISGNWINNGTFNGNTGTVIFNKNGNQSVTGTGLDNFNLIKLNMGTSNSNILEIQSDHFNAAEGFLTLSGGTFKISGTFTFTNGFIAGPTYNIPVTSGLWINNPNVSVSPQAGGVSLRGLLRISSGSFNIGTAADHNLNYVDGASLVIEGGEMNIAGNLARSNSASFFSYEQSGGILNVVTKGSTDPLYGAFDIGVVSSVFSMSGGRIVISNATSAPVDYLNISNAATVTGGTLQIGNESSLNGQTIRIQTPVPVGNLLISALTSQVTKPACELEGSSLTVLGDISMETGTAFLANGMNITLGGNWSNEGTFTAGPMVTFSGTNAQVISNAGGEKLNSMVLNNPAGAEMTGDLEITTALTISDGILSTGDFTITLAPAAILSENEGNTVLGNITITKNVSATSGTENFGNIGADITLNGVALGNTSVLRKTGTALSGVEHNSIKRYFTITPGINTGLNVDLKFHYDPTELNGQNQNILEIYRSQDNGITWNNMGGVDDPGAHVISITGINEMSLWTASDTLHKLDGTGIPSGINQPDKETIFLYPNPAREQLSFSKTLYDVEVLNASGEVVIPSLRSANSIRVDQLTDGTYFIRTRDHILKFVIKR